MKYQGFHEERLLLAAKELETLGLKSSEVYAVMNLAGAKWRSVQLRKGRSNESYAERDGQVFHEAVVYTMKHTMENTALFGKLTHAAESQQLMFLAVGLTLNRLFTRGSKAVLEWLKDGDVESRKIVLSFAIGSCIIMDARFIDIFFEQMVRFRYGTPFEAGNDISDQILAAVDKLGKAGNSVLLPASKLDE